MFRANTARLLVRVRQQAGVRSHGAARSRALCLRSRGTNRPQEVVAMVCLYPTVKLISDPDYFNQFPACLISDSSITYAIILETIR